jgi:hypothetical protein
MEIVNDDLYTKLEIIIQKSQDFGVRGPAF